MNRIHRAMLCHKNATILAEQIKQLLVGKIFIVATVMQRPANDQPDEIEINDDQYLKCDWTDKSTKHIRCTVEFEGNAVISFCDQVYVHTWMSRKIDPSMEHDNFQTPVFRFYERDQFSVFAGTMSGLRITTFKVVKDLPWDTEEYHEQDLRLHWAALGREIPNGSM